jgi:hypothetical protein
MRAASFASALFVAGCGTMGFDTAQPAPPPPTKIVCLPMAEYSQADQAAFADEVASLNAKANPQVLRFLGDYKAMRDANRACHASP